MIVFLLPRHLCHGHRVCSVLDFNGIADADNRCRRVSLLIGTLMARRRCGDGETSYFPI